MFDSISVLSIVLPQSKPITPARTAVLDEVLLLCSQPGYTHFELSKPWDPFQGRTEFPLIDVACALMLTQDSASPLWMRRAVSKVKTDSLALAKIPSVPEKKAPNIAPGLCGVHILKWRPEMAPRRK
jgi:hypothetical protein